MSRAEICRENGNLGGRQGSLNKTTVEIRAIMLQHAPDAFAELARLAKHSKSEQVRIAAIKEILRQSPQATTDSNLGVVF